MPDIFIYKRTDPPRFEQAYRAQGGDHGRHHRWRRSEGAYDASVGHEAHRCELSLATIRTLELKIEDECSDIDVDVDSRKRFPRHAISAIALAKQSG